MALWCNWNPQGVHWTDDCISNVHDHKVVHAIALASVCPQKKAETFN